MSWKFQNALSIMIFEKENTNIFHFGKKNFKKKELLNILLKTVKLKSIVNFNQNKISGLF
jgi:hypothetical protein